MLRSKLLSTNHVFSLICLDGTEMWQGLAWYCVQLHIDFLHQIFQWEIPFIKLISWLGNIDVHLHYCCQHLIVFTILASINTVSNVPSILLKLLPYLMIPGFSLTLKILYFKPPPPIWHFDPISYDETFCDPHCKNSR